MDIVAASIPPRLSSLRAYVTTWLYTPTTPTPHLGGKTQVCTIPCVFRAPGLAGRSTPTRRRSCPMISEHPTDTTTKRSQKLPTLQIVFLSAGTER
ncbi:hypothetical protein BaRGS_00015431 [Batillaria attramentaria]|uniref:Uncharacterized protein n=1 Tax=Batillaria attramentaria TaxID=370345 RepID=A0ABD0L1X7_9CAEN